MKYYAFILLTGKGVWWSVVNALLSARLLRPSQRAELGYNMDTIELGGLIGNTGNQKNTLALWDVEKLVTLLQNHAARHAVTAVDSNPQSASTSTPGSSGASVDENHDDANSVANLPQEQEGYVKKGKKRVKVSQDGLRATKKRKTTDTPQDDVFTSKVWVNAAFRYVHTSFSPFPPLLKRLQTAVQNMPEQVYAGPLYLYATGTAVRNSLVFHLNPVHSAKDVGKGNLLYTAGTAPSSFTIAHDFTERHSSLLRALVDLRDAELATIDVALTIHQVADERPNSQSVFFDVSLEITSQLLKLDEEIELSAALAEAQRRVLLHIFPPSPHDTVTPVTVQRFTDSLQRAPPLPFSVSEHSLQPKDLKCSLLPFQRRSVFWMLNREGFTMSPRGEVVMNKETRSFSSMWDQVSTPAGSTRYLNRITGQLRKEQDIEDLPPVHGGILAEMMGCGKTVECIALMLLNPPVNRGPWKSQWSDIARAPIHEVKTTLIVTPANLQKQWIEEIAKHAPKLKVHVFDGWKSMRDMVNGNSLSSTTKKKKSHKAKEVEVDDDGSIPDDEWARYLQTFDVLITTYTTLAAELSVAKGTTARPRRERVDYGEHSMPKSPLIIVEFWRVIMDEVQMAGGNNTVDMVSRIPRINSFAVSGTPAKASVSDLQHVLEFLRVPGIITMNRSWKRLLAPAYHEKFLALFDTQLAIRTRKDQIEHEFQLPKQTRYIVPIEFGKVERTIYDDILDNALQDLRVDERGVAAHSGWAMDLGSLRNWLHKLRQACTHPQVGGTGKVDRLMGGRGIKSMSDVLQLMQEATEDGLISDRRKKTNLRIRHAQLLAMKPNQSKNLQMDIAQILEDSLEEIKRLAVDTDKVIQSFSKQGVELMEAAVQQKLERKRLAKEARGADGKSDDSDDSDGEDSEEENVVSKEIEELQTSAHRRHWKWWLKTDRGKEWKARITALHHRRRENSLVSHKVQLLLGDAFFRLKNPEKEKHYYEQAELIRNELLGAAEKTAIQSMRELPAELERISVKNANDSDDTVPTLRNLLLDGPPQPGILTTTIFWDEEEVIDILNEQTQFLFEWKDHIIELITQDLISEAEADDDKTPYERAVEVQLECEAFLKGYQSLLADRREALIAERTLLAAAENREDKTRKTAAASKAQKQVVKKAPDEDSAIVAALDKGRRALTGGLNGRALKTSIVLLSNLVKDTDEDKHPEEVAIAKHELARLKKVLAVQTKQMDRLEKQLAPIRKTFNDRIEYFRQLQAINDSVAAVEWEEETLEDAILVCVTEHTAAERAVNTRLARQRYLNSITNIDDEDEEERSCVLCKCDFDKGVILGCVHHFCEDCITMWMVKGASRVCPVCRAPIEKNAIQRIHLGHEAASASTLERSTLRQRRARSLDSYSVMSEEMRTEILDIDVRSDGHGSKIMFLVRHLLWLQTHDPGSKCIVFSTWASGMSIIADALQRNGIRFVRIDGKNNKKATPVQDFAKDPVAQVLLLHGERDVSGLNIVCANRVMLVEPTVNHNFEVQAIARIDRLGQKKSTEVYCYSVEDTVERSILDLAARQGLSLYTKDKAEVAMDVSQFQRGKEAIDAPSRGKKTGDFIASGEDMLAITFPHLYEEADDNMEDFVYLETTEVPVVTNSWGDAPSAPSGSN